MSLYQSSYNTLGISEPRGGNYDEAIGIDIDGRLVNGTGEKDKDELSGLPQQNFYDYDVKTRPGVGRSGSGVIIPQNIDDGFPSRNDYTNDAVAGRTGKKDRGDNLPDGSYASFRMKRFEDDDQESSLDSMLGEVNNGRVSSIKTVEDIVLPFDGDVVINKDNRDTAIKGLIEQNSVNDIFFSDMNMKVVQQTIRYKVHQNTNNVISEQSQNELYVIMRSIMLEFANFRVDVSEIAPEIRRLNQKVIEYAVDNISSNVKQHDGYIKDLSKLPEPLDMPIYQNKTNYTYDISNLL